MSLLPEQRLEIQVPVLRLIYSQVQLRAQFRMVLLLLGRIRVGGLF